MTKFRQRIHRLLYAACLIRVHLSGFRVGTKDTNLNEERTSGHAVGQRTFYDETETQRLVMEIVPPNKVKWAIKLISP